MTSGLRVATLTLVSLATFIAPVPAKAQVTFQRAYGGTNQDEAAAACQLSDGGYIVCGQTMSFGAGHYDLWLVRTDSLGDTLWARTYGGANEERGASVQPTADGGHITAGSTASFGAGGYDAWLVKTDQDGDTIWTRAYGDTLGDGASSVQQTPDGGFILTGNTWSYGVGGDLWLIKTDAGGDTVWTRSYGGTYMDGGSSVQQTSDSGYIIAGSTRSCGAGSFDVWLVKTNAQGDTEWTRTYGGADYDEGYSAQQTSDGGYIVVGITESFSASGYDAWLIKTDSRGDTAWTRTYSYADYDWGFSVQQTTDSGFVVAGFTDRYAYNDAWLIRTDPGGETLWTRVFGGGFHDQARSVRQTADGGFIVAGTTLSYGAGGMNAWLIKTDPLGNVGVEEPRTPSAFHPSPSATVVRRVLMLPDSDFGHCPGLLDATGRTVTNLQRGPNDLGHLPAGVYFVRGAGPGRSLAGRVVVVD